MPPDSRRVLRLMGRAGGPLLLPGGTFVLEEVVGCERRPEDEKMLANDNAGRARAFLKGSSTLDLLDLDLRTSGGWDVADRSFLVTGPDSSAEESGLVPPNIGLTFVGCNRVGLCAWKELSGG